MEKRLNHAGESQRNALFEAGRYQNVHIDTKALATGKGYIAHTCVFIGFRRGSVIIGTAYLQPVFIQKRHIYIPGLLTTGTINDHVHVGVSVIFYTQMNS